VYLLLCPVSLSYIYHSFPLVFSICYFIVSVCSTSLILPTLEIVGIINDYECRLGYMPMKKERFVAYFKSLSQRKRKEDWCKPLKSLQCPDVWSREARSTNQLLSLAPQLSLGLGLLHKIRLNFLGASQQFSFYRVGLLAPRPTPIPEDQVSVFISPRGRMATHFSRLLRHAWVTVVLFLFPGHHTGVSVTACILVQHFCVILLLRCFTIRGVKHG
jgi:hypothetical protein